jgi:uncharacterized membrane protein
LALLLVGSLVAAFFITLHPDWMTMLGDVLGGHGTMDAISTVLARRFSDPWATLLPFALIAAALTVLFGWAGKGSRNVSGEGESRPSGKQWADSFVLILVLWGAFLALFPEYFYLRDFFGTRMNTVFKFYFQAWAFLSIAAAYGAARLVEALRRKPAAEGAPWLYSLVASAAVMAVLLAGSVYYPMAVWTKTNEVKDPGEPTLDASAYLQSIHPADAEAIRWIRANISDNGPLVEAVGNDYDEYAARVATHTGIPDVLGWIGHEDQWRGTRSIHGPRITDIEELYRTTDWSTAEEILVRYGIRYVYFGPLEEDRYGTRGLVKFRVHLEVIYETEDVIIFERAVP